MSESEILYFTDPMCSWCYGFGPEAYSLRERFADRLKLTVVVGGLRAGESRAMDQKTAEEIKHHWRQVHEATGREFRFEFFDEHPGFVYDTEPACRAFIAAWRTAPEKSLEYLTELQRRFYALGEEPALMETQEKAAFEAGLDLERFAALNADPQSLEIARKQFALTRAMGVGAFPSILLRLGESAYMIARGFMKSDDVASRIEYLLKKDASAPASPESPSR